MQRFSRKRQAILDCLRSTTCHPTAEWIHARLLPDFPGLSLTTVYRNLHQLLDADEIRLVGVFRGHRHYDGRTAAHSHACCQRCGRIIDVDSFRMSADLIAAARPDGFAVSDATVCFLGLCAACQRTANP